MESEIRQYEPACECGCFYIKGDRCSNEECRKKRLINKKYYDGEKKRVRFGKWFKGCGWDKKKHKSTYK